MQQDLFIYPLYVVVLIALYSHMTWLFQVSEVNPDLPVSGKP